MSVDPNTQVTQSPQIQPSDKELNFRKQEQMYQKMLAEKEARIAELQSSRSSQRNDPEDDENDDEPYIDRKKLGKALSKFEQKAKQETTQDIKQEVAQALAQERQNNWLENNPDFYDIMSHAEKFAEKAPGIAKSILSMPESFERQKLVYETIKTMGIHKPVEAPSTIQNKIDQNRKSPFYQPSGTAGAPYASQSDFSPAGQKSAYDKLQELKRNLRI